MVVTSTNQKRVCIVGINYDPESTGIAPYTTALARAAVAAGMNVRVITGVPHYPAWKVDARYRRGRRWDEEIDGIDVTRFRHWVPARAGLFGRMLMELSFAVSTAWCVRRDPAELVVAITPSPAALMSTALGRRRRRLAVFVQDLVGNGAAQSGTSGKVVGRSIASVEYWLIGKADRVGVIAHRFRDVLSASGVDQGSIDVIPNFTHVAMPSLSRDDARRSLGWAIDRFTVVHTGNMGMKQGLEAVVAAARLAERRGVDIDFVIVGDGNQRESLSSAAQGCTQIRFMPPVSAADYPLVLLAADVLLVCERPGVTEMSLPSKITSYVAASRPMLASVEADGLTDRYIQQQGLAHVVPAGSPEQLLDGALLLRSDTELRSALVAAACIERRRLSPVAAAKAYVQWLSVAAGAPS